MRSIGVNQILDDQTIEINLPSKIGYERVAMASSAALARLGGLPPARIEDLKSAVAEACINAMQHGNNWRPEARVVVHMNLNDERFIISVTDQGDGVHAFDICEADLNPSFDRLFTE